MFPHKRIFSLVIAVLFMVSVISIDAKESNTAHSDDDYLDYGEAGEELVIIAGRIPEATKTVPAQVTVITVDDIAQSGATSVIEVLETVPGVRFSGAMAGAGSEVISMRGFGDNSHGRVLVLVDGNKINTPDMSGANWNAIPLADIERIEVLDGSASVQYGNNAVGGVINIITKKGGSKRRTLIGLSGGSFLTHRESISHFQPVSWGNFSLSAEYTGTDGYRERQATRATNVSAGVNLFLKDNLSLSINSIFSDLYYQLSGGLTKAQFKDNPKQVGTHFNYWDTMVDELNLDDENTEYHFGGGIGVQWFPIEKVELNLPLSYKGNFIKMDMPSNGPGYDTSDRTLHNVEARPQASVTFDIAGMPLRLLGGVDVYFAKLDQDSFADKSRASKINSDEITEWVIGPYLIARFSPLSNLAFTAGLRFDTAIINAKNASTSFDDDKIFTAFVYDVGVVFNPLDNLKLYAKYSTLFRYPFTDEFIEFYNNHINTDLKPEKGFNVEIGAAWQFGGMLDIYGNFFCMGLEDEIAFDQTVPLYGANVNLDDTLRLGTNIGLTFTPIKLISLSASYTFINAVFTAGSNKNNYIPLVPAHKLYGELLVKLPFGLDFGLNFEFASDVFLGNDLSNQYDKLESWFLLGVRARYVLNIDDSGEFAFMINAKNLLNKSYTPSAFAGSSGNFAYYPGDGFSLNVSLQYRF